MSNHREDKPATSQDQEEWWNINVAHVELLSRPRDNVARVTALTNDVSTLKADQACLHSIVNKAQPTQLEWATSAQGVVHGQQLIYLPLNPSALRGRVSAFHNATTHMSWFPKYSGSDDPLPWFHRCEQFF
jgi:hypothetical protein